jgi:hypothetical protein
MDSLPWRVAVRRRMGPRDCRPDRRLVVHSNGVWKQAQAKQRLNKPRVNYLPAVRYRSRQEHTRKSRSLHLRRPGVPSGGTTACGRLARQDAAVQTRLAGACTRNVCVYVCVCACRCAMCLRGWVENRSSFFRRSSARRRSSSETPAPVAGHSWARAENGRREEVREGY